jgi:hypothetical protein
MNRFINRLPEVRRKFHLHFYFKPILLVSQKKIPPKP